MGEETGRLPGSGDREVPHVLGLGKGWLWVGRNSTAFLSAVDCGWTAWTAWSSCSRTCNVGTRRRFRSGSEPPAAAGGHPCQGPNVEIEFCSLQPCQGERGAGGHWAHTPTQG